MLSQSQVMLVLKMLLISCIKQSGILPVVDNGQLYGVITDRDILQLFFMSQVMEKKEYALGSLLKIRQGVRKIIRLVADKDYNIVSTVQLATKSGKVVIKCRLTGKLMLKKFELFSKVQVSKWIAWFRLLLKYLKPRFLGFSLAIILVF